MGDHPKLPSLSFGKEMETTMPEERVWFARALNGMSNTSRLVLEIAAEVGLETALKIQLSDVLRSNGDIVHIVGAWGSTHISVELWLLAEQDLYRRRTELLASGGTPPCSGAYFYDERGLPISASAFIAELHNQLAYLREMAERRRDSDVVTERDSYYRMR